jgi:hypothetical protein
MDLHLIGHLQGTPGDTSKDVVFSESKSSKLKSHLNSSSLTRHFKTHNTILLRWLAIICLITWGSLQVADMSSGVSCKWQICHPEFPASGRYVTWSSLQVANDQVFEWLKYSLSVTWSSLQVAQIGHLGFPASCRYVTWGVPQVANVQVFKWFKYSISGRLVTWRVLQVTNLQVFKWFKYSRLVTWRVLQVTNLQVFKWFKYSRSFLRSWMRHIRASNGT